MNSWIGIGLDIVTAVAVVLLTALGLYIVYGLMRVINMAHGDLMMLGAYCTSSIVKATGSFWIGVLGASIAAGIVGLLIERVVLRRLYSKGNLATLLATWGLSLCFVEIIRLAVGPSGLFVNAPTYKVILIAGNPYPLYSLILVASAVALIAGLWALLTRSAVGIVIRATIEDPAHAEAAGIDVNTVYRLSFTCGAMLAGLAGGLLAPISAVTPQMGAEFATRSFLVVILGGFGSLLSPISGSAIVGGLRALLSSFFGVTAATVGMFTVVLLLLFFRPQGLVARGNDDF